MTDAQKLAEYLRSTPVWCRIMKALRKKYESIGCSGNVSLCDATVEECNAVTSILYSKKAFTPPDLKFRLADFEKGLQNTKYNHVTLHEVLESYFCQTIQTKQEKQAVQQMNKEAFEYSFYQKYKNTPCENWLNVCFTEQKAGYQRLMRIYNTDHAEAERILDAVCRAVNQCFQNQEPVQLAVLSANLTGNAHFFDRAVPAGRLLLDALAYLADMSAGQNAETINAVYAAYSIEPDTFSGAAAMGIRLFYENQQEHPAYRYFADTGEACMITMTNLSDICKADTDKKIVFVVENPMVFSALTETAIRCGAGLLCTFGQLKLSGIRLVDLLAESQCKIYYAGDFDPEGLQIADKLLCRYPSGSVQSWHMSCHDYRCIEKADDLSQLRLHKLKHIQSEELQEIAELLNREKKSAHQELLISAMQKDMIDFCTEHT